MVTFFCRATFTFIEWLWPNHLIPFSLTKLMRPIAHAEYTSRKSEFCEMAKVDQIHPDAKKNHTCNQSGYSTKITSSLKTHMRIHSREKPFVCSQCNYSCNQADRLRIYTRIHSREQIVMSKLLINCLLQMPYRFFFHISNICDNIKDM